MRGVFILGKEKKVPPGVARKKKNKKYSVSSIRDHSLTPQKRRVHGTCQKKIQTRQGIRKWHLRCLHDRQPCPQRTGHARSRAARSQRAWWARGSRFDPGASGGRHRGVVAVNRPCAVVSPGCSRYLPPACQAAIVVSQSALPQRKFFFFVIFSSLFKM